MNIFEHTMVKEMNKKFEEKGLDIKISKVSHSGDKVMSMGVSFPLKGSSELIQSLKRLGFEKAYKEKRNNAFYLKMEYAVNYDKYAIYQGEVGKYAMLYIENIWDFRRHGILGNPYDTEFPIVVNRNGGRHTFDEKYEKGFLEIKEVLEDEEPLTREDMFPKNSKDFVYGWIDREGNTYACSEEGHYRSAEYLCLEKGINSYHEEETLEELGWIKISRKTPYTPDNKKSQCIYFNSWHSVVTQAQIDTLYKLGLDSDPHFEYLLRASEKDNYER